MSPCPSPDLLRQMLAQQLGAHEQARLDAHLETCDSCESRLAQLVDTAFDAQRHSTCSNVGIDNEFLARLRKSPPGERLPDIPGYDTIEFLAAGGMGRVYRARHTKLHRLVALKMIRCSREPDAEVLRRFATEAEAVAQFSHPNVVQIYEVGEVDGLPYMALEYVGGGTLGQKIAGKPMPPREAALLARSLAHAVAAAHQHGVVHRDLKPANVLLTVDAIPKIADFGLAKTLDQEMGQTLTGAVMGTPSYMAPEQARGATAVIGPLSDVYALGAILYEMLTGRPPFRGATRQETMHQVLSQDALSPSRLQPKISRDLETVCLKCLAKEPGDRYASATELADDLGRYLDGNAVLAQREGLARQLWRRMRRNRTMLAATLLLAIALSLASIYFFRADARSRQRSDLVAGILSDLDHGTLEEEFLKGVEAKLDALGDMAPGQEEELRRRLHHRYGELFRASLKDRTLFPDDIAKLQRALSAIEARDPALMKSLEGDFTNRLKQWQPLFQASGENLAAWKHILPGENFIGAQGGVRFIDRMQHGSSGILFTQFTCKSNTRFEAQWSDSWEQGSEVGLFLSAQEMAGFDSNAATMRLAADDATMLIQSRSAPPLVWDLSVEKPRRNLKDVATNSVLALASDGATLALAKPGESIRLVDLSSGAEQSVLPDSKRPWFAMVFSADRRFLAAGTSGGWLYVWDLPQNRLLFRRAAHGKLIRTLQFSPDATSIATGSDDGAVKLVTLADQSERLLMSDAGVVHDVAFHPRGDLLAIVVEWDARTNLCDLTSGKVRRLGLKGGGRGSGLAFSVDGKHLALVGERGVYWCDGSTGKVLEVFRDRRQSEARSVAITRDNRRLVSMDARGRVLVWNLESKRVERSFGSRHYAFVLRSGDTPIEGERDSFAALREADGALHVEISRDGAVLREDVVAMRAIPRGPLTLSVEREGNRLTLHVEGLQPIVFEEAIPEIESPGVFALAWPKQASLQSLRAFEQMLPREVSPLERGDRLFSQGRIAEALGTYQEQALTASGEILQECRHKESVCLLRLGRSDQAAPILEQLGRDKNERWAVQALCELWLLRLHQRDLEKADAIQALLTSRFRMERIVTVVPRDLRKEVAVAYATNSRGYSFYRHDPSRIESLEKAVAIEKTLLAGSRVDRSEEDRLRYRLARAYHEAGQIDKALDTLDRSSAAGGLEVEERSWLLRLQGKPAEALEVVDRYFAKVHPITKAPPIRILVERARIRIALKQFDKAEEDLERMFVRDARTGLSRHHFCAGKLLLGLLRERRGDLEGAKKNWSEGVLPVEEWDPQFGFEFIHNLLLVSLSEQWTDSSATTVLRKLAEDSARGGNAMLTLNVITPPPVVLRTMWQTPRGRDWAWKLATREVPFHDVLRMPAVLLLSEWIHHTGMPGKLSPEQETLLVDFCSDYFEAFLAGRAASSELALLALTWKGSTGNLGWAGVEKGMSSDFRGRVAYLFGHRYVRLKRESDALMFFKSARDDAMVEPLQPVLRRLAETEIRKLEAKK